MDNKTYETLRSILSELETSKQVLHGRSEELSQVCESISDKVFEKYNPEQRDAYHNILQFNETYDRFNMGLYDLAEKFVEVAGESNKEYTAWKDTLEENGLVFRKAKPAGKSILEKLVSCISKTAVGLANITSHAGGYALACNDGQTVRLVQKKKAKKADA